jgi:hypothetical protein
MLLMLIWTEQPGKSEADCLWQSLAFVSDLMYPASDTLQALRW